MNLLDLLPEILAAICNLDAVACQRLWIYLHNRGEIRPDPSQLLVTTETDNENSWDDDDAIITQTTLFGQLHSVDDVPAISFGDTRAWYHRGVLHRVGGPALQIKNACCDVPTDVGGSELIGFEWIYDPTMNDTELSVWFQHGKLAANADGNVIVFRDDDSTQQIEFDLLMEYEIDVIEIEGSIWLPGSCEDSD